MKVMLLREALRGYVKRINDEAVLKGTPMMRPMFLQFPDDPECREARTESQFMLGDRWLVAPVTEQGAKTWTVYLPVLKNDRDGWVYWWKKTRIRSGIWYTVNVSNIEEFPLFRIYTRTSTLNIKI